MTAPDPSGSSVTFHRHFTALARDCIESADGGLDDAVVRVYHREGTRETYGAVVVEIQGGGTFFLDQEVAMNMGLAMRDAARAAQASDRRIDQWSTGMDVTGTRVRRVRR